MPVAQAHLDAIHALPSEGRVRVLHLSGDQERVITQSGLRHVLPAHVELIAGPGCAASICPAADVYQAVRLAQDHDLTLVVDESLLRVPVPSGLPGPRSLAEACRLGADVRAISAPIEAVMLAVAEPGREVVLFVAGFETLLAPLAGMVLGGLPDNLSLLICGRRVEPMLDQAPDAAVAGFDALLLPGNRCSVLGLASWESFAIIHGKPVAVADYTVSGLLAALHALLQCVAGDRVGVANCYRPLAKPAGNPEARERLRQVFDVVAGDWRGVGCIPHSAFRLRPTYAANDANHRFPDYRQASIGAADLADGCGCAGVVVGRSSPSACGGFNQACRPDHPVGPCMASRDGTCHVHSLAQVPGASVITR